MTIKMTLAQVREATAAAVAERGADYDYKADHDVCRYTEWVQGDDGQAVQKPGCLVGDVMHRLGVPLPVLSQWDDSGAEDLLTHLTSEFYGPGGLEPYVEWADEQAAELVEPYLGVAQQVQDHGGPGHTWGDALRTAEERIAGRLA